MPIDFKVVGSTRKRKEGGAKPAYFSLGNHLFNNIFYQLDFYPITNKHNIFHSGN
jgi:hypothetical protein